MKLPFRKKDTCEEAGLNPEQVEIAKRANQSYPPLSAKEHSYDVFEPTIPKNKMLFGLKLATHLLRLEAKERDKQPKFTVDSLYDGIASGSHKVAIGFANLCVRGVAVSERTEEGYELTHWYVVDKVRGRGIGTKLLEELGIPKPGTAPTVEASTIQLEVQTDNAEAVA